MYLFLYICDKLCDAYIWIAVILNVEKCVVLQIVEAYLSMEQVTCNQLQLIGITAVLLATRCVYPVSVYLLSICLVFDP